MRPTLWKRGLPLLALLLTVVSGTHGATVVCTRELLLRNGFDAPRPDTLVAVPLDKLLVSPADEKRIRSVRVTAPGGKVVRAQVDTFGEVAGFRGELALLVDLDGDDRLVLSVDFLADTPAPERGPTIEQEGADAYAIATSTYRALVVLQGGAPVLRRLVFRADEEEIAMDDILGAESDSDGLDSFGGQPKPTIEGRLLGFDGGLPLAFDGLRPPVRAPLVRVTSGPARAAVTLFHTGDWATAHVKVPVRARQTLSLPARGAMARLDVRLLPGKEVPERSALTFGGVRVASTDQPWELLMGQKPDASPVRIVLDGRDPIILEGWQRSSFDHRTALVTCETAWAGIALDHTTPGLGPVIKISYDDAGPLRNSLQPVGRLTKPWPADTYMEARATFWFGAGKPPDMDAAGDWLNEATYLPHLDVADHAGPEAGRIAELVRNCDPVLLVPRRDLTRRPDHWQRLADRLQAHVQSQESFDQYVTWYSDYEAVKRLPQVLMILAGEPGENAFMDARNREHRLFSRYPLGAARHAIRLVEDPAPPGHMLFLFGNRPETTAAAFDELFALVGELPEPPALSVTPREWSNRMPFSFQGVKDRGNASRATAFRNGHAEHLFLLRANRDLADLRVVPPEGLQVRVVPWSYGEGTKAVVSPFHDAGFPRVPDTLRKGAQLGLWCSRKLPADAPVGPLTERVKVVFGGGERTLELVHEVLAPVLADSYPIGFHPLGGGRQELKRYFKWEDDETYYDRLPALTRGLHAFGVTAYAFDIEGLRVEVSPEGHVTVDISELKREYGAATAGAPLALCQVTSLNDIMRGAGRRLAARREDLGDEYDAWHEVIAPAIRAELDKHGLVDRFTCRHGDEIADYEAWQPGARAFRRAGFGVSVAINGYGVYNRHLGVGPMTHWIPLFNFFCNRWGKPVPADDPQMFNANFRDARLAAGETIWPYVCGPGPYVYGPRPRSYGRFLLLDGYMKKANGITYYGGMVWTHAVSPGYRKTRDADLFGTDCTFVSLFYPNTETGELLPSTRTAVMRMGMEDAAALAAVRRLAPEKAASETVEAAIGALYDTITMEATDAIYGDFRRGVATLYRELAD